MSTEETPNKKQKADNEISPFHFDLEILQNPALKHLVNYIDPNYEKCDKFDVVAIRKLFNDFSNHLLGLLHKEGKMDPNNPYFFNSHSGQYERYLDAAKDEFIKAMFAMHATINQEPK